MKTEKKIKEVFDACKSKETKKFMKNKCKISIPIVWVIAETLQWVLENEKC